MSIPNIPRVYDHKTNKRLAYLQDAYAIGYTLELNGLSTATFTLPANDPKNDFCQPFNLVEIYDGTRRVELFRIMPTKLTRTDKGDIKYECEHVIATLMDDDLFKYHQIGNVGVYTPTVIQYILKRQSVKRWVLGQCDFNRQFEYKWENDKLLAALFSVPKPFAESYHWEYNTTGATWVLNLRQVPQSLQADCEIRYKKNMASIIKDTEPTLLANKIFALGYGEGDNQLTIESVNGGVPFVEDIESVQKYGVKSTIFVDRRIENAVYLKARAEAILKESKSIYTTYKATASDLYRITQKAFDFYSIGRQVRIVDTVDRITHKSRIIKVQKGDVTGEPFAVDITMGDAPRDIASGIAELADRERINELYAQGNTNQFMVNFADNADANNPAVLKVYIPDTMYRINRCVLNFTLEPFRAYAKSIAAAARLVESTTEEAATTRTTSVSAQKVESTTEDAQKVASTTEAAKRTQSTTEDAQKVESTTEAKQKVESTTEAAKRTQSTTEDAQKVESTTEAKQTVQSTTETAKRTQSTSTNEQRVATTTQTARQTQSASVAAQISTSTAGGGGIYQTTDSDSTYNIWHADSPPTYGIIYYNGVIDDNLGIIHHNHPHGHLLQVVTHVHSVIIPAHSHTVEIPAHGHTVTIPEHSHTVEIPAHSHDITIPAHSHTVTIPAHKHTVEIPAHSHDVTIPAHSHTVTIPAHKHTVEIPAHSHDITIPAHSHTVTIPAHSHTVEIPAHSHTVTIPTHSHDMEFGIYQGATASSVKVVIDGVPQAGLITGSDISKYFALDGAGKIRRNYEHTIEVWPDKMTRITASIFCQIFTNSRGGGDY